MSLRMLQWVRAAGRSNRRARDSTSCPSIQQRGCPIIGLRAPVTVEKGSFCSAACTEPRTALGEGSAQAHARTHGRERVE